MPAEPDAHQRHAGKPGEEKQGVSIGTGVYGLRRGKSVRRHDCVDVHAFGQFPGKWKHQRGDHAPQQDHALHRMMTAAQRVRRKRTQAENEGGGDEQTRHGSLALFPTLVFVDQFLQTFDLLVGHLSLRRIEDVRHQLDGRTSEEGRHQPVERALSRLVSRLLR